MRQICREFLPTFQMAMFLMKILNCLNIFLTPSAIVDKYSESPLSCQKKYVLKLLASTYTKSSKNLRFMYEKYRRKW